MGKRVDGQEINQRNNVKRFLNFVRFSPSGCWEWTGVLHHGYGRFNWTTEKNRHEYTQAHRFSYALFNGTLQAEEDIHHECENKSCVNPTHLSPIQCGVHALISPTVTAFNALKTHCVRGHSLSDSYHGKGRNGGITRICRSCASESNKRRWRMKIEQRIKMGLPRKFKTGPKPRLNTNPQ